MITAHAGSCGTEANSLESIQKAVSLGVDFVEMDIRCRPEGGLGIKHDRIKSEEKVTDLRDALLVVKPSGCMVNLDIKESESLPELYELLVSLDMLDRVIMTGLQVTDILKARSQMPGVPYYPDFAPSTKLIDDPEYVSALISFLRASGCEGINCHYSRVTPELSAVLKENGLKLSVWTVDPQAEMVRIIKCRPYNITSRHPDTVMSLSR